MVDQIAPLSHWNAPNQNQAIYGLSSILSLNTSILPCSCTYAANAWQNTWQVFRKCSFCITSPFLVNCTSLLVLPVPHLLESFRGQWAWKGRPWVRSQVRRFLSYRWKGLLVCSKSRYCLVSCFLLGTACSWLICLLWTTKYLGKAFQPTLSWPYISYTC